MRRRNRSPKKMYEATCGYCRKKYTAFRKTSKFCGRDCRKQNSDDKKDTLRKTVLARDGNRCTQCGNDKGRMFVRVGPGLDRLPENARTLCGRCQSAASRELFWLRNPKEKGRKGYVKRLHSRQIDLRD